MSRFLDDLEKGVIAAADILYKERYYEHIDCLYMLIEQCKHYQRLTEFQLSGLTGAQTHEQAKPELDRATGQKDWYRYTND